ASPLHREKRMRPPKVSRSDVDDAGVRQAALSSVIGVVEGEDADESLLSLDNEKGRVDTCRREGRNHFRWTQKKNNNNPGLCTGLHREVPLPSLLLIRTDHILPPFPPSTSESHLLEPFLPRTLKMLLRSGISPCALPFQGLPVSSSSLSSSASYSKVAFGFHQNVAVLQSERRPGYPILCSISQVHSYGTVDYERRPVLKWSSLYRRISTMEDPSLGSGFVLDRWEAEERRLSKWYLCRVAKELRKFRRHKLALEVPKRFFFLVRLWSHGSSVNLLVQQRSLAAQVASSDFSLQHLLPIAAISTSPTLRDNLPATTLPSASAASRAHQPLAAHVAVVLFCRSSTTLLPLFFPCYSGASHTLLPSAPAVSSSATAVPSSTSSSSSSSSSLCHSHAFAATASTTAACRQPPSPPAAHAVAPQP
ncbi:hypothetical protein BHM03_00053186, partial [Ensete ventricosum]